jgi:NAD(P)H-dependent FMN reductase
MSQRILLVVGSIRRDGFNRSVANEIAAQLHAAGMQTEFADISSLPFMNQDIEFPVPTTVAAFRKQVEAASGVWFITPEYNEMIPGVLKNALDWLSRPTEPGTFGAPAFIMNKPVVLTGAGGKKAATVGLGHLLTLTKFMGMAPSQQVVGLQIPTTAFMTGKFILDETQQAKISQQVSAFVERLAA